MKYLLVEKAENDQLLVVDSEIISIEGAEYVVGQGIYEGKKLYLIPVAAEFEVKFTNYGYNTEVKTTKY